MEGIYKRWIYRYSHGKRKKKQQQQNLPKKVTVSAFIFRSNKLTLKGLFRM